MGESWFGAGGDVISRLPLHDKCWGPSEQLDQFLGPNRPCFITRPFEGHGSFEFLYFIIGMMLLPKFNLLVEH